MGKVLGKYRTGNSSYFFKSRYKKGCIFYILETDGFQGKTIVQFVHESFRIKYPLSRAE
jgi:hypothetical protein